MRVGTTNPAALLRDGGVIANGHDAELDELRGDRQNNCDAFLLELEARERARSGIPNLRVQFNKVHGFFIEVTAGTGLEGAGRLSAAARRSRMPNDSSRLNSSPSRTRRCRLNDRCAGPRETVVRPIARPRFSRSLSGARQNVARDPWHSLDVLATLAERAYTLDWRRPVFVKRNHASTIEARPASGGRGPRWPRSVADHSSPTTAGSMREGARCWSSPVPTWAASRTYMRQVAIIVPVGGDGLVSCRPRACRLGPMDAIHTRIGAADDLANAQSHVHAGDDRGRQRSSIAPPTSRWC